MGLREWLSRLGDRLSGRRVGSTEGVYLKSEDVEAVRAKVIELMDEDGEEMARLEEKFYRDVLIAELNRIPRQIEEFVMPTRPMTREQICAVFREAHGLTRSKKE